MEYRDRLRAELAKVDEFLSHADQGSTPGKREYPEFLLTGNADLLEALHPQGSNSNTVH